MKVELLINPFCLCDRDYRVISEKCREHGLTLTTYNLWEIDDEDSVIENAETRPNREPVDAIRRMAAKLQTEEGKEIYR